ncbi:hypothetical protein PENSUB_2896 [Penicillium subrubescens]|uniref:Uncharacterized protein n=1 Tax=Penicillium subrubescens TaxID=1316194 RepID=A0A1Q5UGL5_9EURO|nr:hypothetical protein PENSUB_2896 [Penicillium subrubescens]
MDLIVITTYEIIFSNNKTVTGESVALMQFVKESGKLALRTNKLILDPNPLMSGLAAVSEPQIPPTDQQLADKPTVNHAENVALID